MTNQTPPCIDLLAILKDIRDSGRPYNHYAGFSPDDVDTFLDIKNYEDIPKFLPKASFVAHYFTHPSVVATVTKDSVRWMFTAEIIAKHTGISRRAITYLLNTRMSPKGTPYAHVEGEIKLEHIIEVLEHALRDGFLPIQYKEGDQWITSYVYLGSGEDVRPQIVNRIEVAAWLRQAKALGCRLNMGSFFSSQTINGKSRHVATLQDMADDKRAVGDLIAYVSLMPAFRAEYEPTEDYKVLGQQVTKFLGFNHHQAHPILFNLPSIRDLSAYSHSVYPVAWKDVRFDHVIDVIMQTSAHLFAYAKQVERVEWANFPDHVKKKREDEETQPELIHEGFADN